MDLIRFLIIGGLAFIIDAGITLGLISLGLSAFIARLPALMFAMVFTWLANRRFTFCLDTKATLGEFIRYFAVAISMACFNYLLYSTLIMLNLPAFIALTIATGVQTMLSFYGYKKLAFRQYNKQSIIQAHRIPQKAFRVALWLAALVLFTANFVFKYPGELNPDSNWQYTQALSGQYTDWHPPIMAWVWSLLLPIKEGTASMLTLHLGLHWLGFALIADSFLGLGKYRSAWLVLLSGAFPVFLFYNGMVIKDISMASSMLVAFGLGFRYRITGRPVPLWILLLAAFLLAYGTLVRTNAIFAFGPLYIYLFTDHARLASIKTLVVLSMLLAGLALPLSKYINNNLLGAKSDNAIQALFLFDLNGIAYHSGDISVLPPEFAFSREDLQSCYTSYWWDTLSSWGNCRFAWERLGPENSWARKNLWRRWLTQVAAHPLEYLAHRLKVFNSIVYFLVPAKHCRYAIGCDQDPITHQKPPTTDGEIRMDYIKKNPLALPVNWLALGLILLSYTHRIKSPETLAATRALLLSGVTILLFMVLVGVGTDIRYSYWSIMAIMMATIISFEELKIHFKLSDPRIVGGCALLLLTILAGLLSRFFNFTAFI
jgi:putative flippase GtrA